MRPKPKDIYYIEDNDEQNDENIFIVDNNDILIKSRRNSFREPRKKNSTSSLRQRDKIYPKSLFDLEHHFGSQELWNNDTNQYFTKNELRDGNSLYQSRTLPRCFLKRNFDSVDLMEYMREKGRDQNYDDLRKDGNIMFDSSREYFRKSFDDINLMKTTTTTAVNNNSLQQQQQQQRKASNNLSIQWPTAIPTSPSSFSVKSAFLYNNSNNGSFDYKTIPKFTRGYAFDDRRSDIFESFDLDEIEKERRKSHASLLGIGNGNSITSNTDTSINGSRYDMMNGTAV